MESEQVRATLQLVRQIAAALRSPDHAGDELLRCCGQCRSRRVPDALTAVGMAVWARLGGVPDEGSEAWREDLQQILGRGPAIEAANVEALGSIGDWIAAQPEFTGQPPVVLGDAAVLHSLYGCWDAFEASLWVMAVDFDPGVAATASLGAPPHDLRIGSLGPLADHLEAWSEPVRVGGFAWRAPAGPLLVMLLAGRVGDAEAVPVPPVWFHLAVALLAWRDRFDARLVLGLADELGVAGKVQRGLAMVAEVLPELRGYVPPSRLEIPLWERLLAVPLAARRVVRESVATLEEDDGPRNV